jgi:chromate transporter
VTPRGSPLEVFWAFLRLGLTSFGGPVAHLGYFRSAFVERRQWLSEAAFADLIALCQFLPGPASSQVGFAIGLMRAGPLGAAAAWLGFTAPSAIVMILLGLGAGALRGRFADNLIHGLKLVALAVVAQAVWGMARSLAPDRLRASLAVGALALVTLIGGGLAQLLALAVGGAIGLAFCRSADTTPVEDLPIPLPRWAALASLALFAILLIGLPALATATGSRPVQAASAFYRTGALVFGGGHVVLPLLQDQVVRPGWVDPAPFLAGYAAAQALPGPLFTIAAYLGAILKPGPNGAAGALLALAAIFLPGLLLLIGALPFWSALRARPWAQGAMRGANAAVVGVLGAALYSPVWTSAVRSPADFLVAAAAFTALTVGRVSPVWIVAACAAISLAGGLASG